jgi:succinate dehydrogenase/fumarate reductase flavoprotein subunit
MARPGCHRSLQGATVSGARAGVYAAEYVKKAGKSPAVDERQVEKWKKGAYKFSERKDGILPDHLIIGLLEQLIPYGVTVVSRGDRLEKALKAIEWMRDHELSMVYAPDPHYLRLANEVANMVLVGEMYLKSRLLRTETRGMCTVREDYPHTDNINWLKWSRLKLQNGTMKLWTEDVDIDKYEVKPPQEKRLYPLFAAATKRGIPWG